MELFGPAHQLSHAKELTKSPRALAAIARLERIQHLMEAYGLSDYVSYDLGMVSRYQYYTGIIFKAYTYGTGDYIVTGGRYDLLLEQFGKKSPAVGFAIEINQVLLALERQKIPVPVKRANVLVLFEPSAENQAIRLGQYFRGLDLYAVCAARLDGKELDDYLRMAADRNMRTVLYLKGEGRVVTAIDLVNSSQEAIPLSEYLKEESL